MTPPGFIGVAVQSGIATLALSAMILFNSGIVFGFKVLGFQKRKAAARAPFILQNCTFCFTLGFAALVLVRVIASLKNVVPYTNFCQHYVQSTRICFALAKCFSYLYLGYKQRLVRFTRST